jgi:hypothetical protein
MEEVYHIAVELLFAVISFGFFRTFLAVSDIERFVAADVHVGGREEFRDFGEIFFEERFDIGIGETEFLFRGTAESAFDIAVEFAEVSKFGIIQEQFGVTDGSETGDDIDASCFGVFDDFLDFGGGVPVFCAEVNSFSTDTPFQVKEEGVEIIFGDEVDEIANEVDGFHLPSQIHLYCSDFELTSHNAAPYVRD